VIGSEQSRFLEDFKKISFDGEVATVIKIFVQERESCGTNKVVSVEFGQQFNLAMTQGADEAWVLGKLEKLKSEIRRFERSYATNFKRFGFGINQFLLLAAVVYLPSLDARHLPASATFCAMNPPIERPITIGFFSAAATSRASAT
jgi:hypothetical protein